jgi:hypothetical protein
MKYIISRVFIYIWGICCKGCQFLSMYVINWIKCIRGWMTCYHIEILQKGENENKTDPIHGQHTMFTN